jgi:2-polyprenyl-3-methyl-5-hydroxy-6-metoxy-1,4-benzoquinol methylase
MTHTHEALEGVLAEGYQDIAIENSFNDSVIERCLPHILGPKVLCLGYAGDNWPVRLQSSGYAIDIVEGAKTHYALAQKLDGVRAFYSTFEAFRPKDVYATVIAGSVLEFFEDPMDLLEPCRRFLQPGGRLILTTPNALSIHRRLGALMGLETNPVAVNKAGKASGTYHLYTSFSLRELLVSSGWRVDLLFGAQVKPLPSAQLKGSSKELLRALDSLSLEIGMDFCKTLIAVCTA